MALFTDGPAITIEELAAHDSQLLNVANVENIDVTQKIELAWDELGMELDSMLNVFGTTDWMLWQTPKARLDAVVVTPPLKLWHTYRALQLVYEDAYNSQLNDRYAGKRDRYAERAQWAHEKLRDLGIGIASVPIRRATRPSVAPSSSGPNVADGTYYVTMAWVNRNGEEGASAVQTDITTAGSTFTIQATQAPVNATGWNVYVGTDPASMRLQNGSTLPIGQTWLQPPTISTNERASADGQAASFLKPVPRIIQRG